MTNLMTDDEIVKEVEDYPNPNYLWIEIWEINRYEIQLVLTVNDKKMCTLSGHKVLRLSSLFTDEETSDAIKKRGREVKKLLKKYCKRSEIHSNLHYR